MSATQFDVRLRCTVDAPHVEHRSVTTKQLVAALQHSTAIEALETALGCDVEFIVTEEIIETGGTSG